MRLRRSGILLHPTSLPGPGGIGSLGKEAYRFVDFLDMAGQSLWQVLPLGPTGYGDSPYSSYSAFAGNPLLVDLESVAIEGDIDPTTLTINLPLHRVDYSAVGNYKMGHLRRAAETFFAGSDQRRKEEFWHFCDSTPWLHDFALFMALKENFQGKSWSQWPDELVQRLPLALEGYSTRLGPVIGLHKYIQWQFSRQWQKLKTHANTLGIKIIGDIPIFVAYDSVDVWANRQNFHLDETGKPLYVAGVPPDYFSKSGQLWGNPLYNWDRLVVDDFSWWIARVENDLRLFDMARIDHFRGFESCWEVPFGEKTAINGKWAKVPGDALFSRMREALGSLPLIAEDLGVITPEVEALRDKLGFPGMKILQFAFGSGPDNPYLPHNHVRESVVYTGTHDNDTTAGWIASLPVRERERVFTYLDSDSREIVKDMIRTALMSVAGMCLFPLQDLLAMDGSSRMNVPGIARGNWAWRYQAGVLTDAHAAWLREMTELYGRMI